VIVVDTTVLVYAVGEEHPLREPCRRLLTAQGEGRIQATTTIEVLQEFVHVRARRRARSDAAALARSYAIAFDLLSTTVDDLDLGLDLFERHPRLGSFDALLAAVALNRGAEALVSADGSFADVSGLAWVDPVSPAFSRLFGS
jgi:predicted nucleic acid-binding protein